MAEDGRHELTCSNCGAPLHNLKMLPRDKGADRALVKASTLRQKGSKKAKLPKPAKKKAKRKKSRWGDLFEDAFDIIEDIFD
ncbi:MAG: hypothetical protein AAFY75_15105 [Pseudomonadota bacterium]